MNTYEVKNPPEDIDNSADGKTQEALVPENNAVINHEDPKVIKQKIKDAKEKLGLIIEAQTKMASARSYGIPDSAMVDPKIVELAKESTEEQETLIKNLKDHQPKNGIAKGLKKAFSVFFNF